MVIGRLYTRKINRCIDCPSRSISKETGKRYSTSKCLRTGLFIATGTRDIPTKEQEIEIWKLPSFPSFCPLEECK